MSSLSETASGPRITVAMIADYPRDTRSIDGGVQAVTVYLVRELAKSTEIDLHVVTFDANARSPERFEDGDFQRHILPAQRLGAMTRWKINAMALQKCLRGIDPDLVHAQGVGIDGFLAAQSPYPSVVTVHGMIGRDAKFVSGFVARARLTLVGLIAEKYCVRNATRTILISPYVQEYYGDLLRGTTHLIPNPVDERFFQIERAVIPGRILFAGRLIPRKGVTDLLDALAIVRRNVDARLVFAGSLADERYVRQLREQARSLRIDDAIEFCGLLNEQELLREFSRASLLVLPSYQETAPMVIQQAMAASVPVIATRICGVPYQVEHGRTGFLFEPGDVSALASYIVRLIGDEPARAEMANAARTKAQSEYRAEHVAAQTLSVYRSLAAEANQKR